MAPRDRCTGPQRSVKEAKRKKVETLPTHADIVTFSDYLKTTGSALVEQVQKASPNELCCNKSSWSVLNEVSLAYIYIFALVWVSQRTEGVVSQGSQGVDFQRSQDVVSQ